MARLLFFSVLFWSLAVVYGQNKACDICLGACRLSPNGASSPCIDACDRNLNCTGTVNATTSAIPSLSTITANATSTHSTNGTSSSRSSTSPSSSSSSTVSSTLTEIASSTSSTSSTTTGTSTKSVATVVGNEAGRSTSSLLALGAFVIGAIIVV
jgi:hypothetical protein